MNGKNSLNPVFPLLSSSSILLVFFASLRLRVESSSILRPRLALEQRLDRRVRRQVFVEHLVYLLGDGHLDVEFLRQLIKLARGGHALGLLPQGAADLGQFLALAEREPDAAVTRGVIGAGQDQIAGAGEA